MTAAKFSFSNTLERLRVVGIVEGISFLLLLGVAMPLKYMADMPLAVRIVGMAHGILFMAYVALAFQAQFKYGWKWTKTAWLVFASVMPFGPFIADAKLLQQEEEKAARVEA